MTLIDNPVSGKYKRLILVPGNCLFYNLEQLEPDNNTLFFMAEDLAFCNRFRYHKHKLILLLSSMRSYRDWLAEKNDLVYYEIVKSQDVEYLEKLRVVLEETGIKDIITYDFESIGLKNVITNFCRNNRINLHIVDSPGFMTTIKEFNSHRRGRKKLLMNNFYIYQRRKSAILLDDKGKPSGGKWNFDSQNRESLPDSIYVPEIIHAKRTFHTEALINIIENIFPLNPGKSSYFYLPTTRKDALLWLYDFIEKRLKNFGPYEDAIIKSESFLFHSVISPLMNIGLLTPDEIVENALVYYEQKGQENNIPISSIEGFVRQIIGWREFMRGMYHGPDMRKNFFRHNRKLDDRWYTGELGIEPVDDVIRKVNKHGYCHHIERLMILGNFMLLCETDPDDVYRWFMEMFVDSYEWVMIPNVYGMSQFADGGTLSTKPYISGSTYILKMSDYRKGEWCDVWDALYWRFVNKNRDALKSNFRMGMMVSVYKRMDNEKKIRLSNIAEEFLGTL
ncbi:cryptochrome/photolyase family protein [Methanolobus sp. WCC1]|uniref:cryptochrome/photolyase family protein n=1 Tax=unclassified Methanolobus TaxID=2629569 RepID=UPI003245AE49